MARALLKAAALFLAVSTLGRLLGLVRDLAIARAFGADVSTDAYLVAWMVPETVSTLLLDGAMLFAFVPLFSREVEGAGHARRAFARTVLPVTAAVLGASILVAAASPFLVDLLAPGLPAEGRALAVRMVRIASATVFFMGLAGYLRALLNASGSFGVPAAVYAVYNVGIIGSVVLLGGAIGIESAAWGLAAGSALMVLVQLPSALSSLARPGRRLPPLPKATLDRALVGELALFLPVGAFLLVRHAQVYVERFAGSFLDPGAISHLGYASRLGQFPMFAAITVAMVSFPAISRAVAAGRSEEVGRLVGADAKTAGLLLLPSVAFLGLFSPEIVSLLFERGSFGAADSEAVASVLRLYSLGLGAQAIVYVLSRPFFAAASSRPEGDAERVRRAASHTRGRVWTPLKAGVLGLLATAAADWALLGYGARGLAAGNAAGITVMALVLVRDVAAVPDMARLDLRGLLRFYAKASAAAALACLAALPLAVLDLSPFRGDAARAAVATLACGGAVMAVAYVAAARLMRLEGVDALLREIANKLGIVAPLDKLADNLRAWLRRDGAREREGLLPASAGRDKKALGAGRSAAAAKPAVGPPPILMYHSVSRQSRSSDPNMVCVSPERFEEQMGYLKRRGLVGVSVGELVADRGRAAAARGRAVGLTFDDGYEDFLAEAVPVLERMGFTATVFALGGMLGGENLWDTIPKNPGDGGFPGDGLEVARGGASSRADAAAPGAKTIRLLDEGALAEAVERGMEVASHGLYHRRLTVLDHDALIRELAESREDLERVVGRRVRGFCYPYGSVDARVARAVREAGYLYACSYRARPESSVYDLPRLYVGQRDGTLRLRAKLWLGGAPSPASSLPTAPGAEKPGGAPTEVAARGPRTEKKEKTR